MWVHLEAGDCLCVSCLDEVDGCCWLWCHVKPVCLLVETSWGHSCFPLVCKFRLHIIKEFKSSFRFIKVILRGPSVRSFLLLDVLALPHLQAPPHYVAFASYWPPQCLSKTGPVFTPPSFSCPFTSPSSPVSAGRQPAGARLWAVRHEGKDTDGFRLRG